MTARADERFSYSIPRAAELRRIQLRSNRVITGDLLGQYRSAFRGTGLVYTDIREYQPGDDVKHIHWKATARTGMVYVKSYEEDRQIQVVLAIDASASMRAPFSSQCFAKAVDFSALVAGLAQRGNDLLGLCLFSDEILQFMPPKSGVRRQHHILASLIAQREPRPSTNLGAALSHLRTTLGRPGLIFVVSDFFCPPFTEELKALATRHDVVLVQIQPLIEALPDAGIVSFVDAESDELIVVDTSDPRVRAEWDHALELRREALKDIARSCRVDHIVITDSASKPLIRLMRERALHTRR